MKQSMKKSLRLTLVASALSLSTLVVPAAAFELTSTDIKANKTLKIQQVFNGFGCKGENQSPQLSWANPPKGTKSFAITAYDPDAPTGSGWWHWVVFNIPASTHSLPANASQKGLKSPVVESKTDYGTYGYGGACPPPQHGKHRYQFTVFALSVDSIPLNKDTSAAMVGFMLHQHMLDSATIEAVYSR